MLHDSLGSGSDWCQAWQIGPITRQSVAFDMLRVGDCFSFDFVIIFNLDFDTSATSAWQCKTFLVFFDMPRIYWLVSFLFVLSLLLHSVKDVVGMEDEPDTSSPHVDLNNVQQTTGKVEFVPGLPSEQPFSIFKLPLNLRKKAPRREPRSFMEAFDWHNFMNLCYSFFFFVRALFWYTLVPPNGTFDMALTALGILMSSGLRFLGL